MKKVAIDINSILRKLPADGAAAVLAGVEATPDVLGAVHTVWLPHQHGNFREAVKAVSGTFDDHDWHWPWFDFCRDRFSKHKVWPDNIPGWDSYEPIKPEPKPKTPDDSLNWLSLKDVRAILKAEGIKPASNRRADIYNTLYHQVPFERWRDVAMSNWDSDANAGPNLDLQAHARVSLLVLTLSKANFVADRAAQIGDWSDRSPRIRQANVVFIDKAAWLMYHEASERSPLPGLPPFYPGDGSDLRVDVGK
jgi:hypothetical protein